MKRFIKEYANFQINRFNSVCCAGDVIAQRAIRKIENVLHKCERGIIGVDETMRIIANAYRIAEEELYNR